MAARGHSKIVTYEEVNIYSFVIPLFQLIFCGELISGLLFKFLSLIRVLFTKIQNGRLIKTEILTYEEIQIYSFVISFFCIIFHEKFNFGPILTL